MKNQCILRSLRNKRLKTAGNSFIFKTGNKFILQNLCYVFLQFISLLYVDSRLYKCFVLTIKLIYIHLTLINKY